MRKLSLISTIILLATNTLFAQTLFTYGGNPVDKSEFLRVYKKNAINQSPDYSRKALRDYLDLYALFKMKVKEAELQKIDTTISIQYELGNYRKQLAAAYLTDEEVSKQQVKEAYDRSKEVLHVQHIMILSSPMAPSKDTIEPYRRIDSIYTAITKGKADFSAMAEQFSEDKPSAAHGGDLGYLSAFQTMYSFENVAYNTPVGKVSKPFRTPYGYHILKVLDRKKSEGSIEVAQIMLMTPKAKGEEVAQKAKENAQKVYAELKKGANFEEMVEQYSEDRYSKDNKGVLPKFGVGSYVPEFENAAFALKKPGDISEPIKTEYGYHIIKLINKYPVLPFDSVKKDLKAKVDRDDRSQIAKQAFYENIKKKNNYKEYPENVKKFKEVFVKTIPESGDNANTFTAADFKGEDIVLFELKGVKYKSSDFATNAEKVTRGRVMGPKDAIFDNLFNGYVKTVVTDIEEENIINDNPDFRYLMEEYRDGIMLFELMDKNVWGKASKDSAGLEAYYKEHKDHYKWTPGFRGAVYNYRDRATAEQAKELMFKKGMTDEKMVTILNTKEKPDAISIQRGYYEFDKLKDVSKSDIVAGKLTELRKNEDGTYSATYAQEVFENGTTKTLDEARGYVIAEYQDYLEKSWNEKLRKKYPVVVKENVFDSMVK